MRASTVPGLVGAGGLGQELKNAVDLPDFALLLVVAALVLAADRLSARLRASLL